MKVNRQQLLAVIVLVVLGVVVGVAGLLLAVLPQRSHVKSLDSQIAAAQAKLVTLEREHHRGPVIRAAQLFQLARAMPDSADVPGVIVGLSRAAQASKVSLLSVAPSAAVVQPDGSSALPVNVSIVGSWSGVASFLHALRSNVRVHGGHLSVAGRLFTVDSIQLSPNAPAGSSSSGSSGSAASAPKGELRVTLTMNAFSYGVPVPTVTTSTDSTTTTTAPSGSVQAAGSTG